MEEKFCLKWNDFQSNTIKTFSRLRNEEDFFDVTLVSDDQKQMMAHKVVLSSCSEYFQNILKANKHSHPLICLNGITSMDLENVLDYIYKGEVKIFQESIDKFLEIAQRLKLDGLLASHVDTDKQFMDNLTMKSKIQTSKHEPIQTSQKNSELKYDSELIIHPISTIAMDADASIDEVEQMVSEHVGKNESGDYMCKICGKVGGNRIRNIKNHIETHLEGLSFPCSICKKPFRSRNSLSCHKTAFHKNKISF